jgi:hypothetical protein
MSRWIFVAVALLAVGISSPVFAQDTQVGTWKQDFAKSTSDPAPAGPIPQSMTRTYEMFGDGLKYTGVISKEDCIRYAVTGPMLRSAGVGLDVRLAIGDALCKELGTDRFRPPELMRRMVKEGKLGKKSGQGFYRWDKP